MCKRVDEIESTLVSIFLIDQAIVTTNANNLLCKSRASECEDVVWGIG